MDNPVRVTDFIQKEWSANVAIIPLSESADRRGASRVQQTEWVRERSLWEMSRERPETKTERKRGPPRFEKGAEWRGEVECPNNIIQRAPRKGRMYCRHPSS